MDPLSHIVIGRALTAAFDDEPRWFGGSGAAAILGALAPDVDGVVIPFGWDDYLRAHEIGTHSIAGSLAVAGASAAIVRLFSRRSQWRPLVAAAATGALSHLALDVLSGARIRLVWPFAATRISVPLMAMADPWFIALCVVGAFAWWARTRAQTGVGLRSDRGRTGVGEGSERGRTGVGEGSEQGRTGVGPRPAGPRLVARALVAAAVGFLCVKATLLALALRKPGVPAAPLSAVDARWASFTEWTVFERTPQTLRAWLISSRDGPPTLILSRTLEVESALVQQSRSLSSVKNFLRTHDFGFPIEQSADGLTSVRWSDLRYCSPSTTAAHSIACALWFGGTFRPDGRVVTQEVKVGGWIQKRPGSR
jgi:membrane-bound metal-dependent hydrolase YbcI (DUF457 family)